MLQSRGRHDSDASTTDVVRASGRATNVLEWLMNLRLVERRTRANAPVAQYEQAR